MDDELKHRVAEWLVLAVLFGVILVAEGLYLYFLAGK